MWPVRWPDLNPVAGVLWLAFWCFLQFYDLARQCPAGRLQWLKEGNPFIRIISQFRQTTAAMAVHPDRMAQPVSYKINSMPVMSDLSLRRQGCLQNATIVKVTGRDVLPQTVCKSALQACGLQYNYTVRDGTRWAPCAGILRQIHTHIYCIHVYKETW